MTSPERLQALVAGRRRLEASMHARNTRTAYAHDWQTFAAWCTAVGRESFPASTDTVAYYVTDILHRGRKVASVRRYTSAIAYQHRSKGLPSPVNREITWLLDGANRIRREQPVQKAPVTLEQLRRLCQRRPEQTAEAVRDRAVLLFGFASALRRSNLVALNLADVQYTTEGLLVRIRREKQDQTGAGRELGIPFGQHRETCPVRALRAWLRVRGPQEGPLFASISHGHAIGRPMNANRVALIVKAAVGQLGLDPRLYGAHSLRAGFCTAALESGANEIAVANHTGHRSLSTLRRYYRSQDPFRANACAAVGL